MGQRARILHACDTSARTEALGELLRALSCDVDRVSSIAQILEADEADVLVVDEHLDGERSGLDLCEELHDAGIALPFVFVARELDCVVCRRLDQLGARAVVGSFEPHRLALAIDDLMEAGQQQESPGQRFEQSYSANEFTVRRALHDLTSFLEVSRVAPAHTARIACAAAEVLDNVLRHAYAAAPQEEPGSFTMQADVRGTGVRVTIRDFGRGFDVERVRLDSVPAALPRLRKVSDDHAAGLVQAARLSEAMNLTSDPGGSAIELAFVLTLAVIDRDDDDTRSISADDFHPRPLRRLVDSVRSGSVAWEEVPSSLALTLDRLLGGARAPQKPVVSR